MYLLIDHGECLTVSPDYDASMKKCMTVTNERGVLRARMGNKQFLVSQPTAPNTGMDAIALVADIVEWAGQATRDGNFVHMTLPLNMWNKMVGVAQQHHA